MKAIAKTVYEAHDGKCFDTPEECRRHERDYSAEMLYDLDEKMIQEALTRSTERGVAIANAIERVAYLIANLRREQGDMRRKRKPLPGPLVEIREALDADLAEQGDMRRRKRTPSAPGSVPMPEADASHPDDPGVQAAADMAARAMPPHWPDFDSEDRAHEGDAGKA